MAAESFKPEFNQILSTFAMQALMACGKIMNPVTRKFEVELNIAQFHIGALEILREKTKGNLSAEEEHLLDDLLHQTHMAFVDAQMGRGKIEVEGGMAAGEGSENPPEA